MYDTNYERSWLQSTESTTYISLFHVLAAGQAKNRSVKTGRNLGVVADNTFVLLNTNHVRKQIHQPPILVLGLRWRSKVNGWNISSRGSQAEEVRLRKRRLLSNYTCNSNISHRTQKWKVLGLATRFYHLYFHALPLSGRASEIVIKKMGCR